MRIGHFLLAALAAVPLRPIGLALQSKTGSHSCGMVVSVEGGPWTHDANAPVELFKPAPGKVKCAGSGVLSVVGPSRTWTVPCTTGDIDVCAASVEKAARSSLIPPLDRFLANPKPIPASASIRGAASPSDSVLALDTLSTLDLTPALVSLDYGTYRWRLTPLDAAPRSVSAKGLTVWSAGRRATANAVGLNPGAYRLTISTPDDADAQAGTWAAVRVVPVADAANAAAEFETARSAVAEGLSPEAARNVSVLIISALRP